MPLTLPTPLPPSISLSAFDYLVFQDEGSHKFWTAIEDQGFALVLWGKQGRLPQGCQRVALSVATMRQREKLSNGYARLDLLYLQRLFVEQPQWFAKIQASPLFRSAIDSRALKTALDLELPAAAPRRPAPRL